MTVWISVIGVFVIGAVIAVLVQRYGDAAERAGRATAEKDAAVRRTNENADVMQKQDELAAIAARRDADDAVSKRLSDGTF